MSGYDFVRQALSFTLWGSWTRCTSAKVRWLKLYENQKGWFQLARGRQMVHPVSCQVFYSKLLPYPNSFWWWFPKLFCVTETTWRRQISLFWKLYLSHQFLSSLSHTLYGKIYKPVRSHFTCARAKIGPKKSSPTRARADCVWARPDISTIIMSPSPI